MVVVVVYIYIHNMAGQQVFQSSESRAKTYVGCIDSVTSRTVFPTCMEVQGVCKNKSV